MNTLQYDGYIATVDIDPEAGTLSGVVINTLATLHFSGHTLDELRTAFAETIADYRTWCRERGEQPEAPFSGHLVLELDPELQRRVVHAAVAAGKSVDAFVSETLARVA
jgi:predicted HicB family RNase H-like nuclease